MLNTKMKSTINIEKEHNQWFGIDMYKAHFPQKNMTVIIYRHGKNPPVSYTIERNGKRESSHVFEWRSTDFVLSELDDAFAMPEEVLRMMLIMGMRNDLA
jgi:hypothetical protein